MSVLHQFREILKQRLQAILWRSVASDLETDALLQDAENLDRLEQRARQFEAEGKPQLAQILRTRAATIDPDAPGGTVANALERLAVTSRPDSMLVPGPKGAASKKTGEPEALPSTKRSRRRRTSQMDADRED